MDSGGVSMRTVTGVGIGERATIGKLREVGAGALANGSEIALCREPIDSKRALELFRADFSALVCVGDGTGETAETVRDIGFTTLFVSEESAEECVCGENAIIYPDRDVILVSPSIAAIDDFTARAESVADRAEPIGVNVYELYDCGSERFVGKVVENTEPSRAEDELFEIYSRFAEECEDGYITVLVTESGKMLEHMRSVLRAAVYGRIAIAVRADSVGEYRRFREIFGMAREELSRERREFEDAVSLGVDSGNLFGLLFARELLTDSDFFVADMAFIAQNAPKGGESVSCERYLRHLCDRAHGCLAKLRVCGEREMIEPETEKIKHKIP